MSTFDALRRANPRNRDDFATTVAAAGEAVRERLAADHRIPARPRRRYAPLALAGVVAAAAAAALLAATGGPGDESALAAVRKAAAVTAASAERSGTAVVKITHAGQPWAGATLHWNGDDLSFSDDPPHRSGGELLVVDGTMYAIDQGRWVELGSPSSIDPGSGTTPAEYLAAVREDVGGTTLHRLTAGLRALTSHTLADGTTVFTGTIAAKFVARQTGFKEGQHIRVLPFGYVAHDEAANPASPLDVAVKVQDGIVHEIAVSWGATASPWTYTVTYSGLGATPTPKAPANAATLRELRNASN
jgi:hypothetical protein